MVTMMKAKTKYIIAAVVIGLIAIAITAVCIIDISKNAMKFEYLKFNDEAVVSEYSKKSGEFSVKVYQYTQEDFKEFEKNMSQWKQVDPNDNNYKKLIYSLLQDFVEYSGEESKLYTDFSVNKYDLQSIARRDTGKYIYFNDTMKEDATGENRVIDFTKYENDKEFKLYLANTKYYYVYLIQRKINEN